MSFVGLYPTNMLIGAERTSFEFNFFDSVGTRQARYQFNCYVPYAISASDNWQDLGGTIITGPASIDEIPDREEQAHLMTIGDAQVTWPISDHSLRLTLAGVLTWQWNVSFKVAMTTFQLDGTWTRKG